MRLRPVPDWVAITLAAPLLVAALPVVAFGFGYAGIIWLKRKAVGPTLEWQRWFAWHPCKVDWGDHLWLETVERRGKWLSEDYKPRATPKEVL